MMEYWQITAAGLIVSGAIVWLYLYHVYAAGIKLEHRQQVADWPLYSWIDLYLKVSTLGFCLASILVDHPLLLQWHDDILTTFAGLIVAATGIMLFVAAMRALGQQYSDMHRARLPTEIVQHGPYRFIRHPIYTANILLCLGLAIASGSIWIALNVLITITCYGLMVPKEELALKQQFAEYEEYRQRTGAIFPRLRRRKA